MGHKDTFCSSRLYIRDHKDLFESRVSHRGERTCVCMRVIVCGCVCQTLTNAAVKEIVQITVSNNEDQITPHPNTRNGELFEYALQTKTPSQRENI